jgi:hypothetical protein
MGGRYFVYEAVNLVHKEIVVGISDSQGLDAVKLSHRHRPPRRMSRWDGTEDIQYRVVERSLEMSDALEFAARYSESDALDLFRVYLSSDSLVA